MAMTYDELRDAVVGALMPTTQDWSAVLHEESEIFDRVMELMATAYDESFSDCEFQDSGFEGSTTWTNNNPYRKITNV